MKNKTWLFVLLLSFTAVIIAGTAAYFSVFGLSKLFAGAGLSALILFGALEFGKLVSVSVLYRFWKKFSLVIRSIFTLMVIGIMFITSMGIYGFLRSAYDETSNRYNTMQKETLIQEQRKSVIQLEINRYQSEIDSKNNQINTYISNRTTQEELVSELYSTVSDTTLSSGQKWVARDRADRTKTYIKETDSHINELRDQNNILYGEINSLNDSIMNIDRNILELEGSNTSAEIGPLKYLSELTGYEMDDVVGALIFLIIFVFDPFAIILIIAANRLSMITTEEDKKTVVDKKKLLKRIKKRFSKKKLDKRKLVIENKEEIKKPVKKIENQDFIELVDKEKQEAKPVKQEAKPVKQEAKPVKQESKPVKQESKPVKQEAKPVKKEIKKKIVPGRYSHGRGFRPEKTE